MWATSARTRGEGGKYLLLPPGYTGAVPEGYFVLRSRTYGNWLFFRGFIVDGDLRTGGREREAALPRLSAAPRRRTRPR